MKSSLMIDIETLAQLLKAKGLRLATAESCTGGGIAQALTSVAGSSDWFECGFVSYSNASKHSMLGVTAQSLVRHGAVSEAVVKEMAIGAVANSDAHVSVSVSGVAGPGGGSPEKPVGYVWIAWAQEGRAPRAACFHFQGDREQVRYQAIEAGVAGVVALLLENEKS